MFNLDAEANLPTFFSSVILLFSASLFYILGKVPRERKSGNHPFWMGLSFMFAFLAIDENAKIHEAVGDLTEKFVHVSGYLNYPWVIPYGVLVITLGFFYARFFWRMDRTIFMRFIAAAALYVGGAIGFELLGANEATLHGADTVLYSIYSTIEESLEIFGVIFLISTLLYLLDDITVELNFTNKAKL